jgi:hypothetical protein
MIPLNPDDDENRLTHEKEKHMVLEGLFSSVDDTLIGYVMTPHMAHDYAVKNEQVEDGVDFSEAALEELKLTKLVLLLKEAIGDFLDTQYNLFDVIRRTPILSRSMYRVLAFRKETVRDYVMTYDFHLPIKDIAEKIQEVEYRITLTEETMDHLDAGGLPHPGIIGLDIEMEAVMHTIEENPNRILPGSMINQEEFDDSVRHGLLLQRYMNDISRISVLLADIAQEIDYNLIRTQTIKPTMKRTFPRQRKNQSTKGRRGVKRGFKRFDEESEEEY